MWISLFKKEGKENQPVMDGMIKVTQELKDLVAKSNPDDILDVALWNKIARSGQPYFSGQISEHRERDSTGKLKSMEKKEYKGHPSQTKQDDALPF